MNFSEHITRTAIRARETSAALGKLMPSVGGPKSSKRRVMGAVAHSIILYAAPIWEGAMRVEKMRLRLAGAQRIMALRVCSGYRTVSREALQVISSMPPIELLARERRGGT
ncbi:hypothetical protein NQ314_000578 [Rhamnusium bicolor]|uniref:Uncharacterized protein n=1 Tax=Rhamnusium bicolor TaxID=1586634 RepID=A0AAV8ZW05_9CUCU|nr:hypothetical protein NQ314_000578 [Rhamnusium bicolor]